MKHFSKLSLSAASAILLLSACQSEQLVPAEAPQTTEEVVTITGYLPSENDTKTVRDANGKIFWLHAEEISLFYASGDNGGSKFTSTNVAQTSKAQFTGTIGVITGGSDENDGVDQNWFWGLYPYDATASCDGTYVYTTMKSAQVAQTGSFGDDTFITLGRSQGLSMSFYNVCGGIGFSVTRSDIKRVVLKGNGGEALGGRIKIGMGDDGKPFIAELTDGFTEIELTAPDGGTFTAGEYYYIPTVPVSLPSGFTLEFYTANAKGTYSFGNSLTVARSAFKRKASADAGIEFQVQYVAFADPNFESYCLSNFDTDSDGRISVEEAAAVTTIDVKTGNIKSLGGIEWFTELTTLNCIGTFSSSYPYTSKGILSSLDVSRNVNLTYLDCSRNPQLTTLNVSNNPNLILLHCFDNQLSTIDLSNNVNLSDLDCRKNQLTTLDVSNNVNLTRLYCAVNQLTTLNVTNSASLIELWCFTNQLTALDVSNNANLTELDCGGNQLTSLVCNSINLTTLECCNNQLSSIDLSNNVNLSVLDCSGNQLTALDVSNNANLTNLFCVNNQLTILDVSNNINLSRLDCYNNQLSTLDVSNNTNLTSLSCYSNQLTALDVSNNSNLLALDCRDNQLTELDVSNNTNLSTLQCNVNQLTSLDVTNNVNLTSLGCNGNQLSTLDVSNNTNLQDLQCIYNQLTTLNVSNNANLTRLLCHNNLVTTLDVSRNLSLTTLDCSPMDDSNGDNLLTTLYMQLGQTIEGINSNRSTNKIPAETVIQYYSSEPVDDDDLP